MRQILILLAVVVHVFGGFAQKDEESRIGLHENLTGIETGRVHHGNNHTSHRGIGGKCIPRASRRWRTSPCRRDRSLLRRLRNRRINVKGPSKPDNAEQEHEHDRQHHRCFGDLRPGFVFEFAQDGSHTQATVSRSLSQRHITLPRQPWPRRTESFVDCGLSSDTSNAGIRRLKKAASTCAMLRSVCCNRPVQITTAKAMIPASRIVPASTAISCRGPRHAPSAPASFQSPAPRLRRSTNGSSSPSPSSAPSSADFSPGPSRDDPVDRHADDQARYGQPVRNPPVPPVQHARANRHQDRRNPGARLEHVDGWQTEASRASLRVL